MKLKKVGIIAIASLMLGSTVAFAASNEVKGTISTLKYKLNGIDWAPSANAAKPVVINGQQYIPVSVVTEATKINITVDKSTNTIQIGEKAKSVPLFKEKSLFKHNIGFSKNVAYSNFQGKDYKEVIAASKLYGSANAVLYPNKKYQTLVVDAFALGYKAEIHFVNKNTKEELKGILLEPDTGVTTTEINVAGVNEIEVEVVSLESFSDKKGADVVILPTSYYK
ncbi:stalk domain-containing protein [Paenibacillus sp. sgz500992]|uniref:stalk domain-containing protein n=1 Tax=Paenibacillus sp. sgz500992 TaxID=3242476 RepID=UPI0036D3DE20